MQSRRFARNLANLVSGSFWRMAAVSRRPAAARPVIRRFSEPPHAAACSAWRNTAAVREQIICRGATAEFSQTRECLVGIRNERKSREGFAKPGVVIAGFDPDPKSFDHAVTKRHLEVLRAATDAEGRKLEVVTLVAPSRVREKFASDDFAAGYINFYVCNGAVIAPEFGDEKADAAAKRQLQLLFRGREVVQLNIDGIAAGGGGIHCTTQQEPKF